MGKVKEMLNFIMNCFIIDFTCIKIGMEQSHKNYISRFAIAKRRITARCYTELCTLKEEVYHGKLSIL